MSSRLLADCVDQLALAAKAIIDDYNVIMSIEQLTLRPICTLRTAEEQLEAFKKGRKIEMVDGKPVVIEEHKGLVITYLDGITKVSKHNPTKEYPLSRAVDFGVFSKEGKYLTDNQYYKPLLDLARKYGLRSGWDFKDTGLPIDKLIKMPGFKDPPHVEIK